MTDNKNIVNDYSPDKLLSSFTRTGFIKAFVWAVLLHVIIIGLSSVSLLFAGNADQQKTQTNTTSAATSTTEQAVSEPSAVETSAPAEQAVEVKQKTTDTEKPEQAATNAQHTNTVIMQKITETADTNDIPKFPDDLGISIEDTNRE
jgi:hypothetical protein